MYCACRTDLTEYDRATECKSEIQKSKKDALAVLPHVDRHSKSWS